MKPKLSEIAIFKDLCLFNYSRICLAEVLASKYERIVEGKYEPEKREKRILFEFLAILLSDEFFAVGKFHFFLSLHAFFYKL